VCVCVWCVCVVCGVCVCVCVCVCVATSVDVFYRGKADGNKHLITFCFPPPESSIEGLASLRLSTTRIVSLIKFNSRF